MAKDFRDRIIENYIYFYHLEKFCILPLYPDSIQDDMKSSFAETNSLSRSAPVFTYTNSGPRTVQITLNLHRDMLNDVNRGNSNLKENILPTDIDSTHWVDLDTDDYVDTLIKYIQSAALPKYSPYDASSKSVIPPMVALRFGNEIFIKGVVTSGVNVTYKKPILENGKYACVDISFTVSEVDPYDAQTVARDGSFRGITKAFVNGDAYNSSSTKTVNISTDKNNYYKNNHGFKENYYKTDD